eukprot:2523118-Karenia_brevis.AAC.1
MRLEPWMHPGNQIPQGTGLFDVWLLHGGSIVLHPVLDVPCLEAFDRQSGEIGAKSRRMKTK